ncbi:glycosyltransferase family 2 protein [Oceanicola sp. S124]|uniref:glycosyltransferase family 2 protein n=1 Tax=Oceanicola sp. S124 TaxID=1042378 RepID=UPI0002559400|nr:glycosyltransferase family 2 protein [Oceanicola sp. S124]
MSGSASWALVSTIKAPLTGVLDFAAWHLELGAKRLHIYLDDPEDPAYPVLKAHPRIRAVRCDDAHWRRVAPKGRPQTHQLRQVANASHCYNRKNSHDWLGHIDVDEFLFPEGDMGRILAALPVDVTSARLRPMEVLAPGDTPDGVTRFRAFALPLARRHAQTDRIYPEFGRWLNGGMLSHVAGKLFLRAGLPQVRFRIHKALSAGTELAEATELAQVPLGHLHAPDWDSWHRHYRFRLARGAYRAELKPMRPAFEDSLSLHDLLSRLEETEGEAGLRRFFTEVCTDTPALRRALAAEGLLHEVPMDLARLRMQHFPSAASPKTA